MPVCLPIDNTGSSRRFLYLYPMLTLGQAFYYLKNQLQPLYDGREAAAIAHELLYHITGMDKMARLMEKDRGLSSEQLIAYELGTQQLLQSVPLQYITGKAWFMGHEFTVNRHVLIPRPETEELVDWIIQDNKNEQPAILDVGTGSGCIPISLKLAIPAAEITAYDISTEALEVASTNAQHLGTAINFEQTNFLATETNTKAGMYMVIVSNPPYIPHRDAAGMHSNVKDHEPGIALFVPDDDALVFYKAIALFGRSHLLPGGRIYCELDAAHAQDTKQLFEEHGYHDVTLKQDMHGNWRMLKASI